MPERPISDSGGVGTVGSGWREFDEGEVLAKLHLRIGISFAAAPLTLLAAWL